MWTNDSILRDIWQPEFPNQSPFRCLDQRVAPSDTESPERRKDGFARLLCSHDARNARNDIVFIWSLDHAYIHDDGTCEPSSVVYIEKTKNSIRDRWFRWIWCLVQDWTVKTSIRPPTRRELAKLDRNFTFYKDVIGQFGPLRIWWADVSKLNQCRVPTTAELKTARAWENRLLRLYVARYRCLPLKNRQK
jgi:hypothetical protein